MWGVVRGTTSAVRTTQLQQGRRYPYGVLITHSFRFFNKVHDALERIPVIDKLRRHSSRVCCCTQSIVLSNRRHPAHSTPCFRADCCGVGNHDSSYIPIPGTALAKSVRPSCPMIHSWWRWVCQAAMRCVHAVYVRREVTLSFQCLLVFRRSSWWV